MTHNANYKRHLIDCVRDGIARAALRYHGSLLRRWWWVYGHEYLSLTI